MIDNNRLRVNFQIRVPQVRVVQNGEQLGILPIEKARNLAYDQGLDLVEMVPNAHPPVCHVIDYSKYKYEQKVKHKEHMKKQRELTQTTKEIRLSPSIGQHDLESVRAEVVLLFGKSLNKAVEFVESSHIT